MKKRWLAAAFAAVAAGCLLTGGIVSAGAETPAEQTGTFAFVNGASVRYSVPTGLRFTVQMDAATYAGLEEAGAYKDGKSMSVYIAPADYFEGAAGDYAAVAERAVEAEIGADKIYQNAEEYGSEIYLANAVLTNVLYENVNREFQAIAAIESADADPVWSEPSDVRSVAYVASAALTEEETDETQSAVLNGFVQKAIAEADGVAEGEFNEDGSYEVAVSMESELFLEPEGSGTLALSVSPAADLYVKWTSDNPDVATVDENGKVTAVSEGTANITAEVYGKTATCAVKVEKLKQFGCVDFSAYEVGATEIDGFKAELGETALSGYSVAEDEGVKVLKFEYTTPSNNAWVNMIFDSEVLGDFSDFDFVDMEMKIVAEGNGGGASLGPGYSHPNGITDGQVLNSAKNQWETYTWSLDTLKSGTDMTIAEDMKYSGRLLFTMNPWAAQKVTVYLKNITGYYAGLEIGETAIDLTEQFNLSAEEFSAVFVGDDGTETPVADVTAFLPEETGALTVTVNKNGYKERVFTVAVNEPGTILNLNAYRVGDSYPVSGGTAEVIYDEISGKKALKITNSGANKNSVTLTISGDAVKQIANYDHFVIKARILYEGATANVNLQVSNVTGRPSWGDFPASDGGDGTAHEWVFDKTVNSWTFTPETNSFTIKFQKWDAAPQITIITDIYAYNEAE